jgi:hypothetical protein
MANDGNRSYLCGVRLRSSSLRNSVAATFACIVAFDASLACATSVGSCLDDGGSTTLRSVVANAPEGDVIVLPTTCSTITLTTGAIEIPQNHLTIEGIKGGTSTITAAYASRVLHHTGNDQLVLKYLSVRDGVYTGPVALGGCIFSASKINLFSDVVVSNCYAHGMYTTGDTTTGLARGGAIFSASDFHMESSVVSGGFVRGESAVGALRTMGGNIYAGGSIDIKYSQISGGSMSNLRLYTAGGGISTHSNSGVRIRSSLFYGNHANYGGGIYIDPTDASTPVTITNTALISNVAFQNAGGMLLAKSTPVVSNSTIAFNQGGGLRTEVPMTLQSTISFSNYGHGDGNYDVFSDTPLTIAGDHNLVGSVLRATLPGDTKTDNPSFGDFGFHGGPRKSLPLLKGSPAIDAGIDSNNPILGSDERGAGYQRNLGNAVDIGAYEFDPDPIFANGFEKLEN